VPLDELQGREVPDLARLEVGLEGEITVAGPSSCCRREAVQEVGGGVGKAGTSGVGDLADGQTRERVVGGLGRAGDRGAWALT